MIFVKIFNLFLKKGNKINPLIGNAGVSAVPDSARISQVVGLEYDPTNYLLMHAMGPNVAGRYRLSSSCRYSVGIPDVSSENVCITCIKDNSGEVTAFSAIF